MSEWLAAGDVPPGAEALDPTGFASGALAYDLVIPAGETREVDLVVPLDPSSASELHAEVPTAVEAREAAVAEAWRETLDHVRFTGPAEVQDLGNTLKRSARLHPHQPRRAGNPAGQPLL